MRIITREEAVLIGLTRYFTGEPCKRGHIAERRVKDCSRCVACEKQLRPKGIRTNDIVVYKKKKKIYSKGYREKRGDHLNEYGKQWRRNNPEKSRACDRNKKARKPDKYRAISANNRVKRMNAVGKFTQEDVKNLFIRQDNRCASCRCLVSRSPKEGEKKAHIDHILPISRGGSNWPDNIQILCQPCNNSKGNKTEEEWQKTS